jgi:hypothetical protein
MDWLGAQILIHPLEAEIVRHELLVGRGLTEPEIHQGSHCPREPTASEVTAKKVRPTIRLLQAECNGTQFGRTGKSRPVSAGLQKLGFDGSVAFALERFSIRMHHTLRRRSGFDIRLV